MRAETGELRMVAIAARPASQYGTREQRLTPAGCQALRVEVTGMERPQAHRQSKANARRIAISTGE
jgi:hypothetical protein